MDFDFEEEYEEFFELSLEGMMLVADLVGPALDWGGWDWNTLCSLGGHAEAVAKRWELVHWLREQDLLGWFDENIEGEEDGEELQPDIAVAIMLTHFFVGINEAARASGRSPNQICDDLRALASA